MEPHAKGDNSQIAIARVCFNESGDPLSVQRGDRSKVPKRFVAQRRKATRKSSGIARTVARRSREDLRSQRSPRLSLMICFRLECDALLLASHSPRDPSGLFHNPDREPFPLSDKFFRRVGVYQFSKPGERSSTNDHGITLLRQRQREDVFGRPRSIKSNSNSGPRLPQLLCRLASELHWHGLRRSAPFSHLRKSIETCRRGDVLFLRL